MIEFFFKLLYENFLVWYFVTIYDNYFCVHKRVRVKTKNNLIDTIWRLTLDTFTRRNMSVRHKIY